MSLEAFTLQGTYVVYQNILTVILEYMNKLNDYSIRRVCNNA